MNELAQIAGQAGWSGGVGTILVAVAYAVKRWADSQFAPAGDDLNMRKLHKLLQHADREIGIVRDEVADLRADIEAAETARTREAEWPHSRL